MEENDILTAEFYREEVFDAIFQIKHNKAPGPDRFPMEFYKKLWEVIKKYIMNLFA
jgi:hypothetical protein